MERYVIGVDFGTLSGRAVLADAGSGEIAAQHVCCYPHGVLPGPGPGWALHNPEDYLAALESTIPPLLKESGISGEQVAALAWDVTSCTMLPALADGTPLARLPDFRNRPHALVKLWKHLAAEEEARLIEDTAARDCPELLENYGGRVSAQWMLPKILQILREAPEVYDRTELFLEVNDWLVLVLTGTLSRSRCCAGFKNFFRPGRSDPLPLPRELSSRLESLREKLRGPVAAPWEAAGALLPGWALRLGLRPGTPVAAGIIDAHAGLLGSGVTEEGRLLMAMGTSICQLVSARERRIIPGIFGVVRDSVLPGLYTYEAGQACVGDLLDWFVRTSAPAPAAGTTDGDVHGLLCREAASLPPGSGGLLALDWWNGQRCPYGDDRLSGMMLGMTIHTTPVQQYRALMEATAYGARLILEGFESGGVPIREVTACGGIPRRNPLMMQIYADVLNRPIQIARQEQTTALGAAVLAASAAGLYPGPAEAAHAMTAPAETVYRPDAAAAAVYARLYAEYRKLAEYFARENPVMHRLRDG